MRQIQSNHGHVPRISLEPDDNARGGSGFPSRPLQTHGHLAGELSPGRDVAVFTDNSTGASHHGGAGQWPSHLCNGAEIAALSYWALQFSRDLGASWRSAVRTRGSGANKLGPETTQGACCCCLCVRACVRERHDRLRHWRWLGFDGHTSCWPNPGRVLGSFGLPQRGFWNQHEHWREMNCMRSGEDDSSLSGESAGSAPQS
ncbi:uncharacterized protein B0H64DRAFT_240870 [Chaetomium fimeti]|uniref:Uncharacterized protein n=1 Tax=Chaetomium fimeti TaxID=1854472 RepID=A0AAE0H8B5_9PEZI|nr:hypothetical protein B0H64DRAFT_240870 [Chaetomium fimeti]